MGVQGVDKQQLMLDVKDALYAAKITSYAQGMNIIRAKSEQMGWGIDLGGLARIWKVGLAHREQSMAAFASLSQRQALRD